MGGDKIIIVYMKRKSERSMVRYGAKGCSDGGEWSCVWVVEGCGKEGLRSIGRATVRSHDLEPTKISYC